jgi:hypothetical protein
VFALPCITGFGWEPAPLDAGVAAPPTLNFSISATVSY